MLCCACLALGVYAEASSGLGGIMGELLRDVLEDLSLSAEQQAAAPCVVDRHLTLIARDETR